MKVGQGTTGGVGGIRSSPELGGTGKLEDGYEMRQSESTGARAGGGGEARRNPLDAIKTFFTRTIPNFFKSLFGGGQAVQPPTIAPTPTRGGGVDLSAYPPTDTSSPRRLVEDVLSGTDPELTLAFEKHCEQRLVTDDLTFLREVEAFRADPSREKAQQLYDTYVASSGGRSLNFDDHEREAVHDRLDGTGQVPGNLFDGVAGTVFNQMVTDQVGKFFSANR